jgi:erythromycin esterase-like protein
VLAAVCGCSSAGETAPEAPAASASGWLETARPLSGTTGDYDPLLAQARGRRFVLLGEDTHGTREFYLERARITERLIGEGAVTAVAIEADWPEVERLNRYVRGLSEETVDEALGELREFPRWMWRNAEFRDFVVRLRAHNLRQPPERRVGLYGMDVQNLGGAIASVVAYLDSTDPAAAARARAQYRCFPRRGRSTEAYGIASRRPAASCAEEAQAVLQDLAPRRLPADRAGSEALFSAASAAASVVGAEAYIRAQYAGVLSWNVRDRAMADAVESIARHGARLAGSEGQVVVWAHNTHVGDARATDAPRRGELNLGQLMRERQGEAAYLVGFLTYQGTVVATREWGEPGFVRPLRPALPRSWSAVLHELGRGNLLLLATDAGAAARPARPVLERAVGVIYLPEDERRSHYFEAELARQFDAVVFIDQSRAVTALP